MSAGEATPKASYDQIFNVLRQLLQSYADQQGHTITPDTQLVEDLGVDSVQAMELLLEVEDHFDATIPVNFLPDVQSVHDLVTELERLIT